MTEPTELLPAGWATLMITYDGQHAEEVAYGPQILMDRLRKWLDRYFAMLTTPATVAGQCEDAIELLGKYKDLCEEIKRGDSYHLGRIDAAISVLAQVAPQPAVQALEDTDVLSMSRALFLQREADAKDAARWRYAVAIGGNQVMNWLDVYDDWDGDGDFADAIDAARAA